MEDLRPLFLFSLPRSGSTLLQRMLGCHSEISTVNEPWILLPLLYSLRDRGVYAEYGHRTAAKAIEDLCAQLPGGADAYRDEIKQLTMRIYRQLSSPSTTYFLDKTPRYHFVADEIIRLFDDGRFVFLWRNPLAVVASIVATWAGGRWRPYLYKVDMFSGLAALVDAYQRHQERSISLRYEDLVSAPEKQVRALLDHLDLVWDAAVLGGPAQTLNGRMGDPTGVDDYQAVSSQPLEKWKRVLTSPVRKQWSRRYLRWVGQERLAVMGYDLEALLDELEAIPVRSATAASDLLLSAKSVAWSLVEPSIAREKAARLPQWHRIHSHS